MGDGEGGGVCERGGEERVGRGLVGHFVPSGRGAPCFSYAAQHRVRHDRLTRANCHVDEIGSDVEPSVRLILSQTPNAKFLGVWTRQIDQPNACIMLERP